MAKLNLRQKLEQLSVIGFVITNILSSKDKDGNYIATLEIADAIPLVRGSQTLDFQGRKVPLEANDVTEIKIHEDDMEEAGEDFQIDSEGTTGEYSGSKLILDVSKGGDVWLRKETFAASGNEMRSRFRNDRTESIVKKALERLGDRAPKVSGVQPVAVGG